MKKTKLILGGVGALTSIALIRAAKMKPTQAKTAKINTYVRDKAYEYGEKLGKMVAVETISDPEVYHISKFYRFHEVLKENFPLVFAHCEIVDIDANLLFKYKGKSDKEPVMFMAHQDVVEATGDWNHDPFSGKIIDKTVYGRGTVDTKSSLFCMLQAFEELLEKGYVPEVDLYIASSTTEEIGGDGAPKLAQYLKEQGIRFRFLMDEGGAVMEEPLAGLKGVYGMVGVLEKGYGNLKFIARSQGGHASAPGADTPLVRLGKFMAYVEKHYPLRAQMNPAVREMFNRVVPNMSFPNRVLLGNLWLFEPLVVKVLTKMSPLTAAMMRTTVAFTRASGSDGYNVLPQEAWVSANIRYIPHQDQQETIQILTKLAKKFDLDVEVINGVDSCPIVSHHSSGFQLIEEVAAHIYPDVAIVPYAMTGATDARFFNDVTDNALRFSPLYLNHQQFKSIHGLNENIDLAALDLGVQFYKAMMRKC